MNSILNNLTITKNQHHDHDTFITVSYAGAGNDAEVWVAIPCPKQTQSTETQPESLTRQLVAVKIFRTACYVRVNAEMRILRQIEKKAAGRMDIHFPRVLSSSMDVPDTGTTNLDPYRSNLWFSMTYIPGFTLETLLSVSGAEFLPEELVAHIYVQLISALSFLYKSSPSISHGDLVESNIMLNPSSQAVTGFPDVVLVDFGHTQESYTTNCWEFHDFRRLMLRLASHNRNCAPEKMNGYHCWELHYLCALMTYWTSKYGVCAGVSRALRLMKDCSCDPQWVGFQKTMFECNSGKDYDDCNSLLMDKMKTRRDGGADERRWIVRKLITKGMRTVTTVSGEDVALAIRTYERP